jgi:hypothetical protein
MSGYPRSKVNLHIANCRELAQLAQAGVAANALASSFCLQFELGLGFYLLEILQVLGKKSVKPWPLSKESLHALAGQYDSPDLKELSEISLEGESWLWRMLRRLEILRQVDSGRALRGEIFQSDLEAPSNSLIASSGNYPEPGFDLSLMLRDLEGFESLVRRQRLGHEEY